jgi:hypothetical protein
MPNIPMVKTSISNTPASNTSISNTPVTSTPTVNTPNKSIQSISNALGTNTSSNISANPIQLNQSVTNTVSSTFPNTVTSIDLSPGKFHVLQDKPVPTANLNKISTDSSSLFPVGKSHTLS